MVAEGGDLGVPRAGGRLPRAGVLTNTMATGAYRGAGRPEANYLMERLMEKAARADRHRPRSSCAAATCCGRTSFPYRTHVGEVYDTGDFARMLDGALALGDWNGFRGEEEAVGAAAASCAAAALRSYLEWTGALPTETVDIEVAADGTVTVFSGTQAMGQGLETTYTQLVDRDSRHCSRTRSKSCRATPTAPTASAASARARRSSAARRWRRRAAR